MNHNKKIGRFDGYRSTGFFGFDPPQNPHHRIHFHVPTTPSKYIPIPFNKSSEAIFGEALKRPPLIALLKNVQDFSLPSFNNECSWKQDDEPPRSEVDNPLNINVEYDDFELSLSSSNSSKCKFIKKKLSSTLSTPSCSSMNLKILFGDVDDTIVRITKQIDMKDSPSEVFLEVSEYQLEEGESKISTQVWNSTPIPATSLNTSFIINDHDLTAKSQMELEKLPVSSVS